MNTALLDPLQLAQLRVHELYVLAARLEQTYRDLTAVACCIEMLRCCLELQQLGRCDVWRAGTEETRGC